MTSLGPYVVSLALVVLVPVLGRAWNTDGHAVVCNLARPLLTPVTAVAVDSLLQAYAKQNFTTLCTWATEVEYLPQYSWSPPLHYINTPDDVCSYDYQRDCTGMFGQPDMCISGAVKNYTSQLVNNSPQYNRTEALLFMSNYLSEIHQPLRVGFTGDLGGQAIHVWWLNTLNSSSSNLFQVWDSIMVDEAAQRYYNKSTPPTFNETMEDILGNMSYSIYQSLTVADIDDWGPCADGSISCPDELVVLEVSPKGRCCGAAYSSIHNGGLYAAESIQLACQWAYATVHPGDILSEDYFLTRLPIVENRLLQAGTRLAATLNRIFDPAHAPAVPPAGPSLAPTPAPVAGLPPFSAPPTAAEPSEPPSEPPESPPTAPTPSAAPL